MADTFSNVNDLSSPARRAEDIVPDNATALTDIPKAIYVGTGGNITGRLVDGTADKVWKNVPSGAVLPFRFKYIRSTGTAAADMLALY